MATLVAIAAGAIAASSASAANHAHAASSKYSVVYIPGLTGNPFYSTVACGAAVEAKKLGDVSFSTQGASTFAVNAQTPIVEAVTARHPTAIMISNDDPKAMIPPLLKAQQAGIKIINIDGDLDEQERRRHQHPVRRPARRPGGRSGDGQVDQGMRPAPS